MTIKEIEIFLFKCSFFDVLMGQKGCQNKLNKGMIDIAIYLIFKFN